ncbi:MAG: hypothetical protein CMK07_14985 [Ponticaulis sp.]|nr:hypothetical protein [Ponticaulis sp.]
MARLELADSTRLNWTEDGPRPLTTLIWYPARPGTPMETVAVPPGDALFVGGEAAFGAEIDAVRPHPVVMLSHGTGGAAFQMMWLGRALAERGYIAIAVDHHGNTSAEPAMDPKSFLFQWERAQDISAVLDLLQADENWSPLLDATDISAAGFSIGGYTMAVLAGAVTSYQQFQEFCASDQATAPCDGVAEYPNLNADTADLIAREPTLLVRLSDGFLNHSDQRIAKFVLIAPGPGMILTKDSLRMLEPPALIIAGTADPVTPMPTNASRIADLWQNSELAALQDVTHYDFLADCTQRGLDVVPVCQQASLNKQSAHQRAIDLTIRFLGSD